MANVKQIFTKIKNDNQEEFKREIQKIVYKTAMGDVKTIYEFTEDLLVVIYEDLTDGKYKIGLINNNEEIVDLCDLNMSLFLKQSELIEMFNKNQPEDKKITDYEHCLDSYSPFKLFYGGGYWFFIFDSDILKSSLFYTVRIITCIKTNHLINGDLTQMKLLGVVGWYDEDEYVTNSHLLSQYLYQNGKSYFFSDGYYYYCYNHITKEFNRNNFDEIRCHDIRSVAYGKGYICCIDNPSMIGVPVDDIRINGTQSLLISNDGGKTFDKYSLFDILGVGGVTNLAAYDIWYDETSKRFFITIDGTGGASDALAYWICSFDIVDGQIAYNIIYRTFTNESCWGEWHGHYAAIGEQDYIFDGRIRYYSSDYDWTTTTVDTAYDTHADISIAHNPKNNMSYMVTRNYTYKILSATRTKNDLSSTFKIMSSLVSDKKFYCIAYSHKRNNNLTYTNRFGEV